MLHSARPLFWPLLAAAFALSLSWASPSAHAAKLYKCTTNGEVTYSNEPCRGQSMQVVQPNDGNMVTINTPREQARAELAGEAPELPTIKLPASGAQDLPPSFRARDLEQPPAAVPADTQSAAESFLQRLQAETQAMQQAQNEAPNPAAEAPPADKPFGAPADSGESLSQQMGELLSGFALAGMPNAQELAQESERAMREAWLPGLKRWLGYGLLAGLLSALLFLVAIYGVVRLAVAHALKAGCSQPQQAPATAVAPQMAVEGRFLEQQKERQEPAPFT